MVTATCQPHGCQSYYAILRSKLLKILIVFITEVLNTTVKLILYVPSLCAVRNRKKSASLMLVR